MSSASTAVLASRYRLERRIATGGYGEVWRGTDLTLGRPVAIKLLLAGYAQQPETLARFRAEAMHAAALAHPNIACVYDYAEADPPFLVMEFVAGPSLASLLASGPMDPAKVMDIVAQTASGLDAAHRAGLVHRDVKPGNLLLSQGSVVKITDFGISYAAGSAPITMDGSLMGTPGYIAPERISGSPASPASDLYSLGVVAYECLAGAAPFAGTGLEIALAHRDRPMPSLPASIPADVAALVGELTAKDPRQRPASAGEVAQRAAQMRDRLGGGATVEAAGQEPVAGPVPTRRYEAGPPQLPGSGRRFGWPAWVAAAVIVAAAVLGLALANAFKPVRSAHVGAPASTPASSQRPATSTMVRVNAGSLAGQPVDQVVSRLRQLGLDPRVQWQRTGQQPPGRVLAVQPAGELARGSLVTVLAAAKPAHQAGPGHGGDGHHHRHGPGGGPGNSNG